ncbi:MAG: SusD/RagB family nutrient-binding outer membrane lipoprotein [Bacteroidales bacterium]|nr:SusD/RagB family nutrient-binding outer membrane lipoprotein [Bacteroidales bacterium]
MKRYIIAIVTLVLASVSFSSCDKWLDINENPNYPTSVDARTLLPTVEMRLAEKVGYELNLVGSFWSQYVVQCSQTNQYYTVMTYNLPSSASWFTAPWSVFYAQNLPAIKEIVTTYEKEDTYKNFVFEAKALLAYHLYLLNSLYGDVCYSKSYCTPEYGTINANSAPEFDSEKDIYNTILALLEELRGMDQEALAAADEIHPSSGYDVFFRGDLDSWLQFVNTLYLKELMRDFDTNKAKITALLAEDNFLSEDAAFDIYEDAADKSNPLYESDRRQLNTTQNIRCCKDVVSLLSGSDGRVAKYYDKVAGEYLGTAYGTTASRYSYARLHLAAKDPVYISTVEEAEFLKAEAFARLGNTPAAKAAYEEAVAASFQRYGVNGAAALLEGDYAFDDSASVEEQVHQIIVQKWLGNVKGMPIESWFDINRTGYPVRGTDITKYGGDLGSPAVRFMYSYYSKNYNDNAPEPLEMDVKMWWHK